MAELEKQEERLIRIKTAPTKAIKCMFCDHKGQSMVEETTSVITYFVLIIIIFATWDWIIAETWLYPFSILFIVLPMVAGFFRI